MAVEPRDYANAGKPCRMDDLQSKDVFGTDGSSIQRFEEVVTFLAELVGEAASRNIAGGIEAWRCCHTGARTSSICWIAAEHAHTRAKLGATERDHVFAVDVSLVDSSPGLSRQLSGRSQDPLPNVRSHNLTMLSIGMSEDVLDEVVAVLVARDWDHHQRPAIFAKKEEGTHCR